MFFREASPAVADDRREGGAIVVGKPVADTAGVCQFTRTELTRLASESGYGRNAAMFSAYFRRRDADDGPIVCVECGRTIALHTADVAASTTAAPSASDERSAAVEIRHASPSLTVAQACAAASSRISRIVRHELAPPHWRNAAWYADLVEFDRYTGITTTDYVAGEAGMHAAGKWLQAQWRCRVVSAEGVPCGAVMRSKGFALSGQKHPRGLPSFVPDPATVSIAEHMARAHGIAPPRRQQGWSTGLCDCMTHPASCCEALWCYWAALPTSSDCSRAWVRGSASFWNRLKLTQKSRCQN